MIMTQQFLSGCKNYFTNSKVVGSYIRFAYHEEQLLLYSSNKMCECISIPLRIMLPIFTILRWLKNETNQIMLHTRGREQWRDTCSCEKRAGVRSCIPFFETFIFPPFIDTHLRVLWCPSLADSGLWGPPQSVC